MAFFGVRKSACSAGVACPLIQPVVPLYFIHFIGGLLEFNFPTSQLAQYEPIWLFPVHANSTNPSRQDKLATYL
jgi:hypothetical protein